MNFFSYIFEKTGRLRIHYFFFILTTAIILYSIMAELKRDIKS